MVLVGNGTTLRSRHLFPATSLCRCSLPGAATKTDGEKVALGIVLKDLEPQ